eukprot:CAMPEP_0179082098 /NCGR_PEP_ID=MMETSP0796-20121207/37002_1 /TAXON_ID=73915 /ORGANISM="Pyrodinium bahamense, Strain pbaha01" /LENGTH=394 /DNA_ID=CAMNT_0020779493 /DNA_START=51 /DNA_END=1235 /DNA_ORIENTATION=+
MVCETAEELQARLVLRAMLPAEDGVEREAEEDGEAAPVSVLQSRMRAELDEVLQYSFKRRLARIEKKVAIVCEGGQDGPWPGLTSEAGPPPAPLPGAAARAGPQVSQGVQTEEEPAFTEPLTQAMKNALKMATVCATNPVKAFGPTSHQTTLPDPKEEKEDIPVSEVQAMRATLESLGRSLGSRERQISSLQQQVQTCHDMLEERTLEADAGAQVLRDLLADPGKLGEAQQDRIARRGNRVAELTSNLQKSQEQAKRFQGLVQQQRAFLVQGERIAASGGAEAVARHPAGEVALVPRPPPMGDEQPEVWDVGTAVANPYVVDSWPFEPNVLASRAPKEASMHPCAEETEEDLEEERRRLPYRAGLQLRLPGRSCEEDDGYDDRYQGPSDTARSL